MKKIIFLYWETCPYCMQAKRAIKELLNENPEYNDVVIEKIEARLKKEEAAKYQRTYVPCIYTEHEKAYEATPGESYEECKEGIKKAFESALV